MTAAPVGEPVKWTLFGDNRGLVQRVAALQAANAALEARLAAQEVKMTAVQAELAAMQTSEAAHAAAEARIVEVFKLAKPQRCSGPGHHEWGLPVASEWLFQMDDHLHCVGLPEDQRVHYAQQFLTGGAFQWWLSVREQLAVWTFKAFATELQDKHPNPYHRRYI